MITDPEVAMSALYPPSQTTQISRRTFGISVLAAVIGVAACSDSSETAATAETSGTETSRPGVTSDPPSTAAPVADATDFYDSSVLHSITLSFDAAAFDAMIEAFAETGDKGWLEADVIIDGND